MSFAGAAFAVLGVGSMALTSVQLLAPASFRQPMVLTISTFCEAGACARSATTIRGKAYMARMIAVPRPLVSPPRYWRMPTATNSPQTESTHVDVMRRPSGDTVPVQRPVDGVVDRYVLSTRVPVIVPTPSDRTKPRHPVPHSENSNAFPCWTMRNTLPQIVSRQEPEMSVGSAATIGRGSRFTGGAG